MLRKQLRYQQSEKRVSFLSLPWVIFCHSSASAVSAGERFHSTGGDRIARKKMHTVLLYLPLPLNLAYVWSMTLLCRPRPDLSKIRALINISFIGMIACALSQMNRYWPVWAYAALSGAFIILAYFHFKAKRLIAILEEFYLQEGPASESTS
jgi:hypothetical protein